MIRQRSRTIITTMKALPIDCARAQIIQMNPITCSSDKPQTKSLGNFLSNFFASTLYPWFIHKHPRIPPERISYPSYCYIRDFPVVKRLTKRFCGICVIASLCRMSTWVTNWPQQNTYYEIGLNKESYLSIVGLKAIWPKLVLQTICFHYCY